MLCRLFSVSLALCVLFISSSCDTKDAGAKEAMITPEMQTKIDVIREKIKTYVNAVNARDIDTVVNQWSERAVYKNPFTGELVSGRKGIRSEYEKIFDKSETAKVSVDIKTIRFPVEEKAVEEGTATISVPGKKPMESDFKMIYVYENGNWHILHVNKLGFGLEKAQ